MLILPETEMPKNKKPKPWFQVWLYRLQKQNQILQIVWKSYKDQEHVHGLSKRCKNERLRFHVQGGIQGDLQRVLGDKWLGF